MRRLLERERLEKEREMKRGSEMIEFMIVIGLRIEKNMLKNLTVEFLRADLEVDAIR